ncbi:hypothetical protein HanRHA438_Chr03g0137441 [Helianthus annuus]|nr:hypothetical protein HanRHA438_Chr03g0137441 [Helianthus annuus]
MPHIFCSLSFSFNPSSSSFDSPVLSFTEFTTGDENIGKILHESPDFLTVKPWRVNCSRLRTFRSISGE